MKRRALVALGCAHCAGWLARGAWAQEPAVLSLPGRFSRPDLATDEGGLWALMDREETRLRRSPFVVRDHGLREYLHGLACRLAGEHCPDIRVYPVRTPWFNASMAPNGMMQVWTGLLLRVENEAQLAAVLGHEIGHYLRRHALERLRDARSRSAFGQILGVALGGVGLIAQLALLAGAYAYSREHEREADVLGLRLMREAGYDPREAAKVWDNLREELAAGAGGDPAKKSVLFATHPATDERSASLKVLASEGGGATGEQEYARRIAPFLYELMEDELRRAQYDETLVLCERLLRRQPERADLLYFRGEARRLRNGPGDTELALEDFQQALARGSEPPALHRSLGYVYLQRADRPAARNSFKRYLDAAPQAADAALIQHYLTELGS